MLSDLAPLAEGEGDALLLADCVTSLDGIPERLDEWGVDLAYSDGVDSAAVRKECWSATTSRSAGEGGLRGVGLADRTHGGQRDARPGRARAGRAEGDLGR